MFFSGKTNTSIHGLGEDDMATQGQCHEVHRAQESVTTDSVCDTESVIIAIRKVVLHKYGAHPIDCAMNYCVIV